MLPADHDRPAVYSVAARENGGDRGFSAAALSDNSRIAVLRDLHIDLVQDFSLAVIGEAHAL